MLAFKSEFVRKLNKSPIQFKYQMYQFLADEQFRDSFKAATISGRAASQ